MKELIMKFLSKIIFTFSLLLSISNIESMKEITIIKQTPTNNNHNDNPTTLARLQNSLFNQQVPTGLQKHIKSI